MKTKLQKEMSKLSWPEKMPENAKVHYLQMQREIEDNTMHGINAGYVETLRNSCFNLINYYQFGGGSK